LKNRESGRVDLLATVGQRAVARVVDWIVVFAVWFAVLGPVADTNGDDVSVPAWAAAVAVVVVLVYETFFVAWRGQTPGKMLINIRIVDIADGEPPSVVMALLRVVPVAGIVAVLPGQIFPIVLVVVHFTAGFARDSRGVLDRLARTVVVQTRRPELEAGAL
jgi:uncharacterized RDD family membrane protein YckC